MVKTIKKKENGLFDSIKNKLIELGIDFVKKNIETTKDQILKYIEKNLERRIKREIKRYITLSFGIFIVIIGTLFILYSTFEFIGYLLQFPSFIINLFYGLFLLIIGLFMYYYYK